MKKTGITTPLAVGAICLAGLLTGCAGGSSTSNDTASASAVDAYALKFAQCMREAGFNMPDPGSPEEKNYQPEGDPEAFNEAVQQCSNKLGPAPGAEATVGNDPEIYERSVKAAQCLREQGYNVADPEPGRGLTLPDVPPEAIEKCFADQETAK